MRHFARVIALTCGVLLGSLSVAAAATFSTFGEASDPAGDSDHLSGSHDITYLFASSDGVNATFGARFAPGTYLAPAESAFVGKTFAQIRIDIDQDVTTGSSFSGLGVEYLVEVPKVRGSLDLDAHVLMFSGGSFSSIASIPVGYLPDGFDVMVPLALLGGDDGLFDFNLSTQEILGVGAWSGIVDSGPEFGSAVSTRVIPEPSTLLLFGGGLLGLAGFGRKRTERPSVGCS